MATTARLALCQKSHRPGGGLLEALRRGKAVRCEECDACVRRQNRIRCGECVCCKDMKMFGGPGTAKKPCQQTICAHPKMKKSEASRHLPSADGLYRSLKSSTGYLGVKSTKASAPKPYTAQFQYLDAESGKWKNHYIGNFPSAREAAVAFAAFATPLYSQQGGFEVADDDEEEEEVQQQVLEDLPDEELYYSSRSASGFLGVQPRDGKFVAKAQWQNAVKPSLGRFATAREAAVAFAHAAKASGYVPGRTIGKSGKTSKSRDSPASDDDEEVVEEEEEEEEGGEEEVEEGEEEEEDDEGGGRGRGGRGRGGGGGGGGYGRRDG